MIRFGNQNIRRPLAGGNNYDGLAAADAGTNDPGRLVLDQFIPRQLLGLVTPFVGVKYRSNTVPTEVACLFYDPSSEFHIPVIGAPSQAMNLIYRDPAPAAGFDSGYDFIDDNVGEGWPVPFRASGEPYELLLVTTGIAVPETMQVWEVNIWYELTPRHIGWGRALCRTIELAERALVRASATPGREPAQAGADASGLAGAADFDGM